MARKKKKNKKRSSTQQLSLDLLGEKARQSLESGKFRQARDHFKKLYKHDPEQYSSGLIAAYRGLFDELIHKGQFSNANAVLTNLEKICDGPETYLARLALTLKQGNFSLAAQQAIQYLSGNLHSSGKKDFLPADALVLSFESPENINKLSSSITDDLTAVLSALEDLCEGEYTRALASIRPVGVGSLFAHWKLFIKGLCAFYTDDNVKAQKAFSRLPAGSVPEKSAQAYLLLLEGKEGLKGCFKNIELMKQACVAAGRQDLENVLPRAEYLWRVTRVMDSYKHVRGNLKDFPSDGSGIPKTLSKFYFHSIFQMDESLMDKFMGYIFSTDARKRHSFPLEWLLASRAEALYMEEYVFDDVAIIKSWENFIDAYQTVHGENNPLKAQVYLHLGDLFSVEDPDINPFSFFSFGGSKKGSMLRNKDLAEWSYEKSLSLHPDNRDAHFSLLLLYEKLEDKSKVNNKLDEIIKLFPDDKEALLNAGLRCINRKAFVKGMKYLECAFELDPLDRRLKEQFIIAGILNAKKYAEKSQMDKCRALLPRVLDKASRHSELFNLGEPFIYARWAAFELLAGEVEASQQLMDKAIAIAKNSFRVRYFALIMARVYGVKGGEGKKIEKQISSLLSSKRSAEKAVSLAEVISYIQAIPDLAWLKKEAIKANTYILETAKQAFSRDQVETIVKYAISGPAKSPDLAKIYIEKILINNPDDPLFRFYLFNLNRQDHASPTEKHIDELHEILSLAEKEGDMRLISLVKSTIHEYEDLQSYLDDAYDWDDDDFDDEYWDDDDWDDNEVDSLEGFDFLNHFTLPEPDSETTCKPPKKKGKPQYRGKQLNFFE